MTQVVLRRNHWCEHSKGLAANVVRDRREKECPDNPPSQPPCAPKGQQMLSFLRRSDRDCLLCSEARSIELPISPSFSKPYFRPNWKGAVRGSWRFHSRVL